MLEEFKGRCIQPLQIVEEQCQRALRPGENPHKPPEHQLEAILRVLQRDLRNGQLFSYNKLQFGN